MKCKKCGKDDIFWNKPLCYDCWAKSHGKKQVNPQAKCKVCGEDTGSKYHEFCYAHFNNAGASCDVCGDTRVVKIIPGKPNRYRCAEHKDLNTKKDRRIDFYREMDRNYIARGKGGSRYVTNGWADISWLIVAIGSALFIVGIYYDISALKYLGGFIWFIAALFYLSPRL